MDDGAAPLIVSAWFGAADQARLDAERRAHFPPERNRLPAHLTLFHHLPPSLAAELRARLAGEARAAPPPARLAGVLRFGQGVAYRVDSPALEALRARLADAFGGLLVPQDRAPWRPHVMIQNKADPGVAAALHAGLAKRFAPVPLAIAGLASWRYRGGAWEPCSRHPFRG